MIPAPKCAVCVIDGAEQLSEERCVVDRESAIETFSEQFQFSLGDQRLA
jgi:hypothetical protein